MMVDLNFQTPENICRYMASLIPKMDKVGMVILEPTKGKGNLNEAIHNEMFRRGGLYKVVAPDNFYDLDKEEKFDCILMNPPFSPMKKGYEILYDCMTKTNSIIALMPYLTIINGEMRTYDIMNFGLKSITHLPRSVFKGSRVQTCILEMLRGWKDAKCHTYFQTLPSQLDR
jgi:type I restriction-modification system DNA methylase subunit